MHQAVLAMGFVRTVRIVKTRRSARLGEIAVCVDDVEHAGLFFEVEMVLAAADHPVAIQDQLDDFARSLGVALERVTRLTQLVHGDWLGRKTATFRSRGGDWVVGHQPKALARRLRVWAAWSEASAAGSPASSRAR